MRKPILREIVNPLPDDRYVDMVNKGIYPGNIKAKPLTGSRFRDLFFSDEKGYRQHEGPGFIYLIRQDKFRECNVPIYKIGMTGKSFWERAKQQYKFCELFFLRRVARRLAIEKIIKKRFGEFFHKTPYGSESFCGNRKNMVSVLDYIIDMYDDSVSRTTTVCSDEGDYCLIHSWSQEDKNGYIEGGGGHYFNSCETLIDFFVCRDKKIDQEGIIINYKEKILYKGSGDEFYENIYL